MVIFIKRALARCSAPRSMMRLFNRGSSVVSYMPSLRFNMNNIFDDRFRRFRSRHLVQTIAGCSVIEALNEKRFDRSSLFA